MGRILALQGGMAVGKTTVARFLAEQGVPVFPEDISRPAARCRALGLDKRTREGYSKTQRLFIANEIERWQAAAQQLEAIDRCAELGLELAVLDLGPQEIEFYTLHYPASIGQDWPVAEDLAPELAALRRCRVDRTLFLDASPAVLKARCRADATRDRGFFAHSTRCLLPAKRAWFAAREDVDFLATDGLPAAEVCRRALDWVRRCGGAPAPR